MIDCAMNRTKVKRGSELPHSKLNEDDVAKINALIEHREALKRQARELSNSKLAEKFDVHVRTIDRIGTGETWGHVA